MNFKYLMDSNVLATSDVLKILDSDFFREYCVVVDEIAYELRDIAATAEISKYAVSPTINTLRHLKHIVDDLVKLGILKTDHGNGDALLLAEALSIMDVSDAQSVMDFMKITPVIVTDEKAVDTYAKNIGIRAISGREFLKIFTTVTPHK